MKNTARFIDLNKMIENFRIMRNKRIIIWGTGRMGKQIASYIPLNIQYFVDNNERLHGQVLDKVCVKSPENLLMENKKDMLIIVASEWFSEIKKQLEGMGFIENINFICGRTLYNFKETADDKNFIEKWRKEFWNLKTNDIVEAYKDVKADFNVLEEVLNFVKPKNILDIGCGSGRIFPIYKKLNIKNVLGQDISIKALENCKGKFPEYEYTNTNLNMLPYKENHFDLIISNRVLCALPKEEIETTIKYLCNLTKMFYINEYSDKDYNGDWDYWYKYDINSLIESNGFECIYSRNLDGLTKSISYLFKKVND